MSLQEFYKHGSYAVSRASIEGLPAVGRPFRAMVDWVGDLGYFSRRVIKAIVTRRFEGAEFLHQLDAIGAKSLRWQHSRVLPLIQSRRVPQCFSVTNPNLLNRVITGALISRKQASLVQEARVDHAHDLHSSISPAYLMWITQ